MHGNHEELSRSTLAYWLAVTNSLEPGDFIHFWEAVSVSDPIG